MTNLLGTNLASKIVPFTTEDSYPTHIDIYGKGGYRCVADIIERDAITSERKSIGMIVYVISEDKKYKWTGTIFEEETNSTETEENSCNEIDGGSASVVFVPASVMYGGHASSVYLTSQIINGGNA